MAHGEALPLCKDCAKRTAAARESLDRLWERWARGEVGGAADTACLREALELDAVRAAGSSTLTGMKCADHLAAASAAGTFVGLGKQQQQPPPPQQQPQECECARQQQRAFGDTIARIKALDRETCAELLARWNEAAAFADCSILVTLRQPAAPRRHAGGAGSSEEQGGVVAGQTEQDPGCISLRLPSDRSDDGAADPAGVGAGNAAGTGGPMHLQYRITVVDIAAKLSSRILERPGMGLEHLSEALQELDLLTSEGLQA
eukprot:CAMPEP_0118886094 /NCGR_PEP_ID=MMETSP1163-20130328/24304_1 /TAXON_ID=124430 /ORGANISM="Phaeomonas parva, Strain CCMP2877" /LENGTH=259 /DNA_ID=CAMNT_0006824233 /DNA_START=1 /DNA_END=780 /DNA_ORIENTATION=+